MRSTAREPVKLLGTSMFVTISLVVLSAEIGVAGSDMVRNKDGTIGRLSPLGNDLGIYSDPHGNQTIITKPGTESPVGLRPHGELESGNRSSAGTPLPPNNLTPAPVLPFHPNRALSPQIPPPNHQAPTGGTGRLSR